MNEHDRANLNFLLNAGPDVIKDWESKVGEDDLEYAQELLNMYALELKEQSRELLIEAGLIAMEDHYPDANALIDRIKY